MLNVQDYRDINSNPKYLGMMDWPSILVILGDDATVAWDRDVPHILSEDDFANLTKVTLSGHYKNNTIIGLAEVSFAKHGFVRCIIDKSGITRWILVRNSNNTTPDDFWRWYR